MSKLNEPLRILVPIILYVLLNMSLVFTENLGTMKLKYPV